MIKKINLALQGGGAHGAFAVGAIDALLKSECLAIDSISATSAGAINAILIAQGIIDGGNLGACEALFKFWADINEYGKVYNPVQPFLWESIEDSVSYFLFEGMTGFVSPYQFNPLNFNPLRELLEKHIDFEKVRKSQKIKLFISATNVKTGKIKIFNHQELCVEAILASTCLPFLFQAARVNEEYYWDGGYMGNPALFPLIYDSDVKDILIIHINPIVRDELPKTTGEIKNRINEISFNSSLSRELRKVAFVTQLLDKGWVKDEHVEDIKRVYIHSLRSDSALVSFSVATKFNTNWEFLLKLFDLGRGAAREWLKDNYDKIGKSSTVNMDDFL
jgi:NTE family protein